MIYLVLLFGYVMLIIGTILIVEYGSKLFPCENDKRDIILNMDIPFLSIAIASAILGNTELLFGVVIGSALFYILVICGVCSMLRVISVKRSFYSRELPFAIFSEVALLFLAADYLLHGKYALNQISRWDGILLILFFLLYCLSFLIQKKEWASEKSVDKKQEKNKFSIGTIFVFMIGILLGIVLIFSGSYLAVTYTSQIAFLHGIHQDIIGMTLATFGAGIPCLIIMVSGKKKNDNIIDGLIPAMIVNILLTIGISAVIRPIIIGTYHVQNIIFLYVSSLLLWFFTYRKGKLGRLEGCIFISIYIVYMFFVCIR